jgi:hypothetical protein
VRVIYGMPLPELAEEARRGKVILGGCIVEENQPEWLCLRCGSPDDEDPDEPDSHSTLTS